MTTDTRTCSHVWIDPTDPPHARSPKSPIIGDDRHTMKPRRRYICRECGLSLTTPASVPWRLKDKGVT